MKSSIKIDFMDRGTGVGIEPVIRVELIKSDDPRDTLLHVLFESLKDDSLLQISYSYPVPVSINEKRVLIFKPESK